MSKHYANYHKHRAAFYQLFEKNCPDRILLMQGISGSGKSSLIANCIASLPDSVVKLFIQLRPDSVGMEEIFSRSAEEIGVENLGRYAACLNEVIDHSISLSNVAQLGATNTINVALNGTTSSSAARRTTSLIEAWFEDMRAHPVPLVVVFDAFEQAPSAVQDWISGPFLSRVAKSANVRVAIAGQRVPVAGIEWGTHSKLLNFSGVPEPSEWVPVIREMGKTVPEPAEVYIASICRHLKGHPSDIMNFIEAL